MGFTPGYEKGFNDPNEKEVFLCWKGANPDESSLLGKLTFGGPLAVNSYHKLSTSWGQLKASRRRPFYCSSGQARTPNSSTGLRIIHPSDLTRTYRQSLEVIRKLYTLYSVSGLDLI